MIANAVVHAQYLDLLAVLSGTRKLLFFFLQLQTPLVPMHTVCHTLSVCAVAFAADRETWWLYHVMGMWMSM